MKNNDIKSNSSATATASPKLNSIGFIGDCKHRANCAGIPITRELDWSLKNKSKDVEVVIVWELGKNSPSF